MRIIDSITLFITATIEHVLFRLFFTWGYDADGNQTTIKTKTGVWQVTYNGENRPIRWEQIADADGNRIVFNATIVTMTYDRMGRRVTKTTTQPDTNTTRAETFVYDGYLQVANHSTISNRTTQQFFIWDPTEPVATRPLVWNREGNETAFYLHDGNKNVSEVVSASGEILAHYTYAPFGDCTAFGFSALSNPWRFSSEYADDELGCVYYNYREYECQMARMMIRDYSNEDISVNLYSFVSNRVIDKMDFLGLFDDGGVRRVCKRWVDRIEYSNPPIPPVWVKECAEYEDVPYKGHSNFINNGTECPFDYTLEDHSFFSSPLTPWGLWRHFRGKDGVEKQLVKDIACCDADAFQRHLHQLQDYWTHRSRGWSVWTIGHLIAGTSPDMDKEAQGWRWDEAESFTRKYVSSWLQQCKLCYPCKWARKYGKCDCDEK